MAKPINPDHHAYLFTDDIKFIQKIVVRHPTDHDRFLAIQRSEHDFSRPGDRDLPGGNICYPELHDVGAFREIQEESGLSLRDHKLYTIFQETSYHEEKQLYRIFNALFGIAEDDNVILSDEHQQYKRVTAEEFIPLTTAKFLHEVIQHPMFALLMKNIH